MAKAMAKTTSKSFMYHGAWCLAIQQAISKEAISRHFESLYEAILGVLNTTLGHEDQETIDQEAMQVRTVPQHLPSGTTDQLS